MRRKVTFLSIFFWVVGNSVFSQEKDASFFTPDPSKVQKFQVYLSVHHGGMDNLAKWKEENTVQYYKEIWYYTESFYIRRNHLAEGITLNESIIDISRFEDQRKQDEESVVVLPGFRDALVLLPTASLKYKPVKE